MGFRVHRYQLCSKEARAKTFFQNEEYHTLAGFGYLVNRLFSSSWLNSGSRRMMACSHDVDVSASTLLEAGPNLQRRPYATTFPINLKPYALALTELPSPMPQAPALPRRSEIL